MVRGLLFKRKIIVFIVISALIYLISCEAQNLFADVQCSECFYEKPDSADLVINLTKNEEYPRVVIKVFEGNIDTGNEIFYDTVYSDKFYLFAPVDEFYSVMAIYTDSSGKTVNVIDGGKMKSKYITDACDEDCYVIRGGIFDAKLKY